MEQLFITNLRINKVRHLNDISIPLSDEQMKHLIFTGKNGSGKTSVMEALASFFNSEFIEYVGLVIQFNKQISSIYTLKQAYHYVFAYYKADRIFQAEKPKHIEKIQLRDDYELQEFPRNEFVKYLLDLKMTEALARNNKKSEKADEIQNWFERLEQLLKKIFDDKTVELVFDEETFDFHILQQGKEPVDFNTLSSGYQAVLDIVLDLMMLMQHQAQYSFG